MQEFASQESCEQAAKVIEKFKTQSADTSVSYRNGILATQCVKQ